MLLPPLTSKHPITGVRLHILKDLPLGGKQGIFILYRAQGDSLQVFEHKQDLTVLQTLAEQ